MPDVVFRGRTTGQLYRFMFSAMAANFPSYLDTNGVPLVRITINGESATNCSASAGATVGSMGIRDGSLARGVITNSSDPYRPGWLPSDIEQP